MKSVFVFFFSLFFGIHCSAIPFEHLTLKQSMEKAKKTQKMVYAFIGANWCEPCEIMKKVVFNDASVIKLVDDLTIPVMIDYKGDQSSDWEIAFKIRSLPTHLLLDTNGSVIAMYEGAMGTHRFKAFLRNEDFDESTEPSRKLPKMLSVQEINHQKNHSNHQNWTNPPISKKQDINTNKPTKSSQNKSPESHEKQETSIDFDEYVIQYGAFNTLDNAEKYQKKLMSKFNEETVIVHDLDNPTMYYKIISKQKHAKSKINSYLKTKKSQGLDCFKKGI